jgi:IclR family mhp operon transcriptional activator
MEFISRTNGAGLNAITRGTGLNRGTVYRMLETLCEEGFLVRGQDSSGYWLSARTAALASGYDGDGMLAEIAQPYLERITRLVKWPCSFVVPRGARMVSLAQTDHISNLKFGKTRIGISMSVFNTAAGMAYLAFADETTRENMLRLARTSDSPDDKVDSRQLMGIIRGVRSKGIHFAGCRNKVAVVAAPVLMGNAAVGAIAIRFFSATLSRSEASRRLGPVLRTAARELGDELASAG